MLTIASPTTRKRSSLRLPATDHDWWAEEVSRVARKEKLLRLSVTGLMHRIAEANLDLSDAAITRYQRSNRRKKKPAEKSPAAA